MSLQEVFDKIDGKRDCFESQVLSRLSQIETTLKELKTSMATQQDELNQDAQRVLAVATTETQILAAVNTIKQQDSATIANLIQQVATLQAANPALDFSGLESNLSALETNAAAVLAATASSPAAS